MIVLIDAGHNKQTPGKRSQDGSILEYEYNLRIAENLQSQLFREGINSFIIDSNTERNGATDGEEINNRVKLANMIRKMTSPNEQVILVSIHLDASDNVSARGMTCFIAEMASEKSKILARCITWQSKFDKLNGNRSIGAEGYRTGNFAIVRDTSMPAVLVECAFMTNAQDQALLKSAKGRIKIAECIATAIKCYNDSLKITS